MSGNTSTVIVALPAANDPINDIGPEQKHATILYFGGPDDHADPQRLASSPSLMKSVLRIMAAEMQPFDAKVKSTAALGNDDPQAQVVLLDSPELQKMFDEIPGIDSEVNSIYQDAEVTRYPSYKPHVTLGYGGDVDEGDLEDAGDLGTVRFDRLALWHGDEQTEFPLGHRQGLVAGVKFVRTALGAKRFGVPIGSQIRTDAQGHVTVLKKGTGDAPSGGSSSPPTSTGVHPAARQAVQPVDPNRQPAKFVPTVPGQKAKLSLGSGPALRNTEKHVSGQSSNPSSHAAPSHGSKGGPWAVTRAKTGVARAAARGLRPDRAANTLGRSPSPLASRAFEKIASEKKLTPAERAAAISTIRQMLRKLESTVKTHMSKSSKSSKSSASKTAASKSKGAAKGKGSKPRSAAQKAASSAAYSKAREIRDLKRILEHLTGQKAPGGAGHGAANGAHGHGSGSAQKTAPRRSYPSSFAAMDDSALSKEIRSLSVSARTDPRAKNSLAMARREQQNRNAQKVRRARMRAVALKRASMS